MAAIVDQIGADGSLLHDVDTRLSRSHRHALILNALPGAIEEDWAGIRAIRDKGERLLSKQVTYLGKPWCTYKKRSHLPR